MPFGIDIPGIAAAIARSVPIARNIGLGINRNIPNVSGPLMPSGARSRISPRSSSGSGNYGAAGAGVASALGALIRPQQEQVPAEPENPLGALYQQLISQLQAQQAMPTGIDTENLMAQVRAAIDPIYDQRAASAEARTGRARQDVEGMYRSLADEYRKLAPEQVAQAQNAKKEIESLYGELRSNIEGTYSRVSDEQSELFKSLGIEAALPEVLDEQQDPVQDALIAASENQAQQQQRYMDIGQMDSTYYREGAPNAVMQGNEVSQNLLFELQDYLNQIDAERSSGIQTAYMDQLGQAQSQLAQQQQMVASENARRQGMLWEMLQGQMQAAAKPQEMNVDSFMGSLPANLQNSVARAFTQLERSPEAIYGKVQDPRNPVPGTFVETTPQWYMAQADQMLQNGQIDAATHQNLLMYLQLYFGTGGR